MLALAAARLGLKTHIYCEESGPAFDVATAHHQGRLRRQGGARPRSPARSTPSPTSSRTCRSRRRSTCARCVPRAARRAKALEVAQDRLAEKQFIAALGDPGRAVPRRRRRRRSSQPRSPHFGAPAILKTRRLGYDGKGQASVQPGDGRRGCVARRSAARRRVLEKRIAFALRDLGAGRARPSTASSPSTTAPSTRTRAASCAARWCRRACPTPTSRAPATSPARIADALDYVGVLAVEMFHLGARRAGGRAADGQRDRAARAQQRPLDHRGLRASASSRTTCAPSPAGRSARPSATAMPRW